MTPLHSTHPTEAALVQLHQKFCSMTGRDERYSFYLSQWHDFSKHFTEADLELVLRYIIKENSRRHKQYAIRTALLDLIGDLAHFEGLRAEATLQEKERLARARKVQPSQGSVELAKARGEPEPVVEQEPKRVSMEMIIDGMRNSIK